MTLDNSRRLGWVAAAAFVATVFAANWAITEYGFVPVGFGLEAPAGVYFAGLALLLRDLISRFGGRWLVLAAIVVGAACSWVVADGRIALASGVAFLVSELADWACYEPLSRRTFTGAVVVSNTVGAVVDSVLFLAVAGFGLGLASVSGLVLGKLWVTAAAVPVIVAARRLAPSP